MQLINKNNKVGAIIFVTILLASLALFINNRNELQLLEKNGVYVLGKLYSASAEGETSWVYKFQFSFHTRSYFKSYNGKISAETKKDSLIFFKILPENPAVCRQLQDIHVPDCLTLYSVPESGWKELPKDTCR
jgi:5-hydroxyisourate hydrolase-like protein (transthyretin family)